MRSGNHWLQKEQAEETQNDKIHVQSLLRQQEISHKALQDHQAQPAAQPSPLMNHVPQCHFPTSQISPGLGSPRCPGQPLPVPGRPLCEEILPESLSEPLPARTGLRGPSGSRAEARTWSCPAASPAGGPYPPIIQQQHVVCFCSDRSVRTVIYSGKQPSFTRFISLPGSLISRSPHYQDVALSQG